MNEQSLRGLARLFYSGEIDRDAYRQRRRELIDGIVAGTAPLVAYQPPPPKKPPPSADAEPVAAAKSSKTGLIAGIGVAAVVIVVVAIVLLRGGDDPADVASGAATSTQQVDTATRDALQGFLAANDWRSDNLQSFLQTWQSFDLEQRGRVTGTLLFEHLGDAVFDQILEEQALAEFDDGSAAVQQQRHLLDFARAMGLSGGRFAEAAAMLAVQSPVALADVQDDTPTAAPLDAGPLAESAPPVLEERLGLTESAATELAAIEDATAPTDGPPQPPIDELQEAPSVAAPDIAVVEPTVPAAEETIAHGVTAAIEPVTEAPIAATAEQPVEAVLPAVAQTQEQAAEVLPPVPEPAVEQTAQGPAPTVEEPTAEAVTAPAPAPLPSTAPAATTAPLVAATPAPQPAATQKRRQGCVSELAKKRRPFCRDRLKAAGAGPTMVVLPAGEYTMGGSKSAEQPSRIVKIAYNFAMSVNEVTVAEFKKFCAETQRQCPEQPWNEGGYPVVNVSWNDAQAYGKWLSTQTGKLYRLPTEAEWEYSARAGTTSKYPFGDELLPTHARFAYSTTPESPLPKADRSINRNKFRLYHMVGNVREWVADSGAQAIKGRRLTAARVKMPRLQRGSYAAERIKTGQTHCARRPGNHCRRRALIT